MFTGLIREVGKSVRLERRGREGLLSIHGPEVEKDARPGDSIAVDGTCLTVERLAEGSFTAFISGETLERTTLGTLHPGDPVNLEPSLKMSDRLGGHLVQGHVEGVATVLSLRPVGTGWTLVVEIPEGLEEAVVPKGSIALGGVSLTVATVAGRSVEIALIPATLSGTTIGSWKSGARVNVETDLIGRYVLSHLNRRGGTRSLTLGGLIEKGF